MPTKEILIGLFVILILGLALPLSHGARMFIIVALVGLVVLTLIGTSVHYYLGGFGSYR